MSVIVLVADGLRPDALDHAINSGNVSALARLREEGSLNTITSVFPSVTGPAYAPFLLGRFPGPVGLPGLRWYDRSRKLARMPFHARSYVGPEMRYVDMDLNADSPTIFEIAPTSLAAMNVINRGLSKRDRIGTGLRFIARTGLTHFRGNVRGWLAIDREIAAEFAQRVYESNPDFAFAAFTGIDKTSHAVGHESSLTSEALAIVDEAAARIRANAEKTKRWKDTHLWIVSDHGHSAVSHHEHLAGLIESWGLSVVAHPWPMRLSPDAAVMVSGNAMAHLYLGLSNFSTLESQRDMVVARLLERPSVDLLLTPAESRCAIRSSRGDALLSWFPDNTLSYEPGSGDPLGMGLLERISPDRAYDITRGSDYPDSLVQIAHLAQSPRVGDIVVSAAPGWDFRAKYEPIPHVSTHGSLRREHMLVPLLTNRPPRISPRRTTDLMPSALAALRLSAPANLDGVSFV